MGWVTIWCQLLVHNTKVLTSRQQILLEILANDQSHKIAKKTVKTHYVAKLQNYYGRLFYNTYFAKLVCI